MKKEYYTKLLKLREKVLIEYNEYCNSEDYLRKIALNLPIYYSKILNTTFHIKKAEISKERFVFIASKEFIDIIKNMDVYDDFSYIYNTKYFSILIDINGDLYTLGDYLTQEGLEKLIFHSGFMYNITRLYEEDNI